MKDVSKPDLPCPDLPCGAKAAPGFFRHPFSTLAFLAIGGLAASGCALATATSPRIDVASVQLRDAGLLEQNLAVDLCAFNPNDQVLAFRRITVGIDVAGTPLADGISETAVQLPPHQAVLVPFSVTTTVRNIAPQLAATLLGGAVPYRLHGTVQLMNFPGLTIPFSRSGRLNLLTVGQALLADPVAPAGTGCGNAA